MAVGFAVATLTYLQFDTCTNSYATVNFRQDKGYAIGTEQVSQALQPPYTEWLRKHAHLSPCMHILVYMLCVYTWTISQLSEQQLRSCRGFSGASQISWQLQESPAVIWMGSLN